MTGILNKAQADALFQREAVLIGSGDNIPTFRVAALFGEDAVRHVNVLGGHKNAYGVGDYSLGYITYRGFLAAASFYNVQQLRESAE